MVRDAHPRADADVGQELASAGPDDIKVQSLVREELARIVTPIAPPRTQSGTSSIARSAGTPASSGRLSPLAPPQPQQRAILPDSRCAILPASYNALSSQILDRLGVKP